MTKAELVESLTQKAGIKKIKAEVIVDTLFYAITRALMENHRVEIRGFGSFVNREYEPYLGRNPRSGEKIKIPSKRVPFFKIGKEFKKRLNGNDAVTKEK